MWLPQYPQPRSRCSWHTTGVQASVGHSFLMLEEKRWYALQGCMPDELLGPALSTGVVPFLASCANHFGWLLTVFFAIAIMLCWMQVAGFVSLSNPPSEAFAKGFSKPSQIWASAYAKHSFLATKANKLWA